MWFLILDYYKIWPDYYKWVGFWAIIGIIKSYKKVISAYPNKTKSENMFDFSC